MKKIFFISSILVASLGTINAQNKETKTEPVLKPAQLKQLPDARSKDRVAEIAKLCNLKPDQTIKLTNLYVEYFTKSDALKAKKNSLELAEYAKQVTTLKNERDASLKSILTADQIKTLQQAKKEIEATKDGAAKPRN